MNVSIFAPAQGDYSAGQSTCLSLAGGHWFESSIAHNIKKAIYDVGGFFHSEEVLAASYESVFCFATLTAVTSLSPKTQFSLLKQLHRLQQFGYHGGECCSISRIQFFELELDAWWSHTIPTQPNASTYNQMASKTGIMSSFRHRVKSLLSKQSGATQTLYADQLVDSIRSIVPCAQPTSLELGEENGDQWNCPTSSLCTYEGMISASPSL